MIVGRDEPLVVLERFVGGVAAAPATLVIEGEAGIGKTTVWQAGIDMAARRGYRVLACRPVESEAGLAYAGLADLLAGVEDDCFDVLPGPQRDAIDVALLRSPATGRAAEPRAIFTAFGGVLRALTRDVPVLVAVDDRQWLDSSTQRALEFVSRRLVDEPIGMLVAARVAGAPASATGPVLRLGPLSAGALHRLIKTQTGVSLSRPAVMRVHRTTAGNPFFALELARVLVAAGLPEAGESWPVPEDLRDMVSARLARLPSAVRSALLVAAADARPAISGLDDVALATAEQAGIVTIAAEGRVRFAHPLFAAVITAAATAAERRRVHARLAARAEDVEERARHRALACEGPDEDVARLLDRAAAAARARGAPDIAAELAERAAALTPPDRPGAVFARRLTAAEHHFHAGDLEHCATLLAALTDVQPPGVDRSHALRLLGEARYRLGSVDEALALLRRAIDAAAGDPGAIARAQLSYAFALVFSFGSFAEAGAAAERARAVAQELADPALLSSALAVSVYLDVLLGRGLDEDRMARALALEDLDQSAPIEHRPSLLAGLACLAVDRFDRARSILGRLGERLVERGEESDLPEPLTVLAIMECFAGDLRRAAELADRAYELARQAGSDSPASLARAGRALVHAQAGDVEQARAAAAEATALAARSGWQIGAFWASIAIAHLELVLGNDDAVVAALAPSVKLVELHGVVDPHRRPFLPDAIEALVHLGDLDRAERLTEALEDRARALDRRATIVSAARCRALIEAARGDVPGALERLDLVLRDSPSVAKPLELARALIVKGQLERRRKHKRQASESLQHAVQICQDMGAILWAQRAEAELARLRRRHDPDELTASEARVAELAASGLSNREVAATAFLSPKTVEANISRIYRKLGIRSRAELGAWLADRERVPD